MRKVLLTIFSVICAATGYSQTVAINTGAGTSGNVIIGLSNYHVLEAIYLDAEIGATNFTTAGSAINYIGFSLSTASSGITLPITASNYSVYMKDVPAGTTTFAAGTYSLTGYTLVFSGTLNITNYGWNTVTLTTPYVRAAGTNLQVLFIRNNNTVPTGTPSFDCSNGNSTAGTAALTSRRYNSTTAPAENSTSLSTSAFRPSIKLQHLFTNDIGLSPVYALGTTASGVMNKIQTYITNNSTSAKSNVQVNLSVTGANTYSTSVTIPSLGFNQGLYVTFPNYMPMNNGTNTITISIAADDVAGNNSSTMTQTVTSNQLNYDIGGVATSGVNAGQNALIGVKFGVRWPAKVSQAQIYFNTAGNTYNVMIYNNNPATGLPNTVVNATDSVSGLTSTLGLNTVTFPTPVNVTDTFYLVVRQTGTALGAGYQTESPNRPNAYFLLSSPGGTWFDLSANSANIFRMMMGVTFQNALPINLLSFTGTKDGKTNLLNWTTATEFNNKAFELQRSADGANFSAIGTINSKAENGNSASALNYSFTDEKPFAGTNYYRLKQIDRDGKATYSSVVILKGDKSSLQISAVYPSPAKDNLNIAITSTKNEKVAIVITDISGKTIRQINTSLVQGDNNLEINVSALAKGSYYIRLIMNDEVKTSQFIKN